MNTSLLFSRLRRTGPLAGAAGQNEDIIRLYQQLERLALHTHTQQATIDGLTQKLADLEARNGELGEALRARPRASPVAPVVPPAAPAVRSPSRSPPRSGLQSPQCEPDSAQGGPAEPKFAPFAPAAPPGPRQTRELLARAGEAAVRALADPPARASLAEIRAAPPAGPPAGPPAARSRIPEVFESSDEHAEPRRDAATQRRIQLARERAGAARTARGVSRDQQAQ